MIFADTQVPGVRIIELERRQDSRGYFARTWCRREFTAQGIAVEFAQANAAQNRRQGTLRGLHYNAPPHEEAKLIRCPRGAAWFVAVDLRRASEAYRRWTAVELSAENGRELWLPLGCAVGYQTLCDDTEIAYLMSEYYQPDAARGIRYSAPQLNIPWPLPVSEISAADLAWPEELP